MTNRVKGVAMKRWTLVVILCVSISGCVSSQIIPSKDTLSSIRTIAIVPIEGRPLVLHPETKDDKMALDALMRSTNSLEVSLSKAVPATYERAISCGAIPAKWWPPLLWILIALFAICIILLFTQ